MLGFASSPRGAREHPSSAASSLVTFELGQPSSSSLVLSRQVSSTHCSIRREFPETTEPSEGGTITANSSLRCCSLVTSSDMTSEKREPSIEDSMVTQDCELMLDFTGSSAANTPNVSNRAGASNSGGLGLCFRRCQGL